MSDLCTLWICNHFSNLLALSNFFFFFSNQIFIYVAETIKLYATISRKERSPSPNWDSMGCNHTTHCKNTLVDANDHALNFVRLSSVITIAEKQNFQAAAVEFCFSAFFFFSWKKTSFSIQFLSFRNFIAGEDVAQ